MIYPASGDGKVEAGKIAEVPPVKDRTEKLKEAQAPAKPVDPVWENGKRLGLTENCIRVLMSRYLKKGPDGKCTETPEELFTRVAHTVAVAEAKYGASPAQVAKAEREYFDLMVKGIYMPNSPTLMNAGREMGMLSACFVLPVPDSIEEIFDTVKATALIQKAGGGTGFAFDRLRPTGDYIKSSGGTTSGPISFWRVLSEATNAIQQGAFRRGANMGMMKIDHPDILKFIFAKQDLSRFQNYNISVKVTDAWMDSYKRDASGPNVVQNYRTGARYVLPKSLKIEEYQLNDLLPLEKYEALPPESRPEVWTMANIWDTIIQNAWATGEPGVVFIDRINQKNPTPNVGEMEATNPCGEQPLLPFEACNLGSVNLGYFVTADKKGKPSYDWDGLRKAVRTSTRFLENVVEVNNYVIPQIAKVCTENRKIGLGIMGFADALFKLGVGYNTDEGIEWGEKFMKFVNDEAHNESEKLAEERGVFKNWKGSRWELEWKRKQRNACSTTVAPTGTISIIANCSGGVEPLFSLAFFRHVMRDHTGKAQQMVEVNEEFKRVAKANNFWGYTEQELFDRLATEGTLHHIENIPEDIKRTFVCAHDITPEWHVKMQAAFQRHCDSSISKTTNFPNSATPEQVRVIYEMAYETGCKGITVYRDGCRKGQPMALKKEDEKPTVKEQVVVKEVVKEVIKEVIKPQKTPSILSAVRIRQNTPFGHMHLTISVDPKSERELEVFAQLGKAGDVAASDLEAICRMVSLFLRSGGSIDAVIDQLEGIGSHLSIPTKDGRVMSLGDALGKTIRKYSNAKKAHGLKAILLGEVDIDQAGNGHGNGHGNGNGGAHAHAPVAPYAGAATAAPSPSATTVLSRAKAAADELLSQYKLKCPECGAGTLAFMEGCVKCGACGYSKC
ncbi:MAG TPA: adenosylcobalamin-dependent ribonucleoside-diphosphate reductase [Planctomycetota bacterium]|nr:adenosylcobalamin-dependent ribonucleoside-diphosphate reductase [Planctomycetota bacterium]